MAADELSYFDGELLDAAEFELEQQYSRPIHARRVVIVVEIDAGDGFELWEEVVDLTSSGPDDRHFVLDRERGVICFGDGDAGKRPPGGAGIRVHYRHGDGSGHSGPDG
jgi:hypothetical protein